MDDSDRVDLVENNDSRCLNISLADIRWITFGFIKGQENNIIPCFVVSEL